MIGDSTKIQLSLIPDLPDEINRESGCFFLKLRCYVYFAGMAMEIAAIILQVLAGGSGFHFSNGNLAAVFLAIQGSRYNSTARCQKGKQDAVGKATVFLSRKRGDLHTVLIAAPGNRLLAVRRSANQPQRHHVAAIGTDFLG